MNFFCAKLKIIHYRVIFLDEHELDNEIQDDNTGQAILDLVFRHLNLMETAYFGLRFIDKSNQTHWLDPIKKLRRQINWGIGENADDPYVLYFGVKFYAVDPCKLIEEITRYQFFLQVKNDILHGRLPVSFELAAELGAYIVQSELGDYDPRRHSYGYVSEFRFLQNQTVELETRVAEYHKNNIGLVPSVAELNYLDKIKWLELYGVDLHAVLGEDNVEYFLGLTPSGIVVLRNKTIVGNYYWPRISKIYFKGRYFMLRVTDKNNDESTYGFETPSKSACKHLWKCCIEHHAFFRLYQVSPATAADIFGLGSRFRFSGRTEKQAVQDAKMCIRNPPTFFRTPSRRRVVEGAVDAPGVEESRYRENSHSREIKLVSIPQPVQISSANAVSAASRTVTGDSPRSTRSAPWTMQSQRGLYGIAGSTPSIAPGSPQSFRSASGGCGGYHRRRAHSQHRHRSSSVDSHSSTDSKTYKRHRHHRNRGTSDNESELSKCSGRSHRRHRRSSGHRYDSGSEPDTNDRTAYGRSNSGRYELIDSCDQWKEVQRRRAAVGSSNANTGGVRRASVVSSDRRQRQQSRSSGTEGVRESESEASYRGRTRRHRKHRSRSRSPAEADSKSSWLPDELKRHLDFNLVDTTGMSEAQLKEIPYTVVQTSHARQLKLKNAALNKKISNGGTIKGDKSYPNLESYPSSQNQSLTNSNNGNKSRHFSFYDSSLLSDMSNGSGVVLRGDHLDAVLRVDHEHTDSGLGAEQDYDFSISDRKNGHAIVSATSTGRAYPSLDRNASDGLVVGLARHAVSNSNQSAIHRLCSPDTVRSLPRSYETALAAPPRTPRTPRTPSGTWGPWERWAPWGPSLYSTACNASMSDGFRLPQTPGTFNASSPRFNAAVATTITTATTAPAPAPIAGTDDVCTSSGRIGTAGVGLSARGSQTRSLSRAFVHRDGPLRLQTSVRSANVSINNTPHRTAANAFDAQDFRYRQRIADSNEKLLRLLMMPEQSLNGSREILTDNSNTDRNTQSVQFGNGDSCEDSTKNNTNETKSGKTPDGGEMSTEL